LRVFNNTEFIDDSTKKYFERVQRARIEKKLTDLQLQRGIVNINEIKNVNDLFKDDYTQPMNFWINSINDKILFDRIKTDEELEAEKLKAMKNGSFYFKLF
jgi:hypothetical protein